jgi:hypothetical protein
VHYWAVRVVLEADGGGGRRGGGGGGKDKSGGGGGFGFGFGLIRQTGGPLIPELPAQEGSALHPGRTSLG